MAFIDFRKAFDHIWRPAMYYKMIDKGVTGLVYHLIKDMYTNNKSAVKMNDKHTNYFVNNIGVRQGDGLSPTLFNIFINDIINELLTDECTPANISGIKVGCLLYADDLVIASETTVGLRESLGKLDEYCYR